MIKNVDQYILIDPVFFSLPFVKDFTPLAFDIKDMPAPTQVLITHGHYDHLDKINEMIHEILNKNFRNIHSIVLIKNGRLILEEYFYGYDRETKHFLASVSKSVTSVIIGIAIDKNFATGFETKVWDKFQDGTIQTDGGLHLRPRDMAKIGYLMLKKGS